MTDLSIHEAVLSDHTGYPEAKCRAQPWRRQIYALSSQDDAVDQLVRGGEVYSAGTGGSGSVLGGHCYSAGTGGSGSVLGGSCYSAGTGGSGSVLGGACYSAGTGGSGSVLGGSCYSAGTGGSGSVLGGKCYSAGTGGSGSVLGGKCYSAGTGGSGSVLGGKCYSAGTGGSGSVLVSNRLHRICPYPHSDYLRRLVSRLVSSFSVYRDGNRTRFHRIRKIATLPRSLFREDEGFLYVLLSIHIAVMTLAALSIDLVSSSEVREVTSAAKFGICRGQIGAVLAA